MFQLFDTTGFSPRWLGGEWSAVHGWTHVAADVAIFGAYLAIPLSIAFFLSKRRDIQLSALWWLFGAFVLSCGMTHLIEATLFWHPWYRLSALMKVITALVSWATVVVIYRSLPTLSRLPGMAQLNRELRRSERNLEITLNAIGDAVLATDDQGRVTRVNPVAERLTGWAESEAIGRPVEEVFRIVKAESGMPQAMPVDEVLETGQRTKLASHTVLIARDGTERMVADSTAPILDASDELQGTVLVFRDVLEEVQAAEEERRQIEKSIKHKTALLDLRDHVGEERDQFCRLLTELVAEVMDVGRVSVWCCDDDWSTMTLTDSYDRKSRKHESGRRLQREQAPTYFDTLQMPSILAISDIQADTATRELARDYFEPLGVVSTLDAPIRLRKKSVGVVCCEQTDGARAWTSGEEEFVSGVAGTIEVALEAERRRVAEEEIRRLNRDLTGLVEERTEELSGHRQTMALLLDNLTEGVVACGESGQLSFFNRTAREWHGGDVVLARPDQFPTLFDLFEPDGITPMAPELVPLTRALSGERVRGQEMVIALAGESPRTVVCNGDRLVGADGEELGAVVAMRDVTLRRKAEAELRRAAERTELAVEAGGVGIWEMQLETNDFIWNDQMFEIYGLDRDREADLDYARWKKFVHPEDLERIDCGFREACEGSSTDFGSEFRIIRQSDRAVRFLRTSAIIFRDEDGRSQRILGTNLDLTEERSREQALAAALDTQRKLTTAARAGEEAKGHFLAVMSHELRTPMNAVIGFSELLKDSEMLSVEDRESVETIIQSGEGLLRIVNDVLEFSRMGSGQFEIRNAAFSPVDLAREVAGMMRGLAVEKGLDLRVKVDAGIPAEVIGDGGRTKQILVNLINNGLKFTDRGFVSLQVGCRLDDARGGDLEFLVEDSGRGLSPEDLEVVFEPFRQRESGLDRTHGGTGLGLAICRRLSEVMDGELTAESDLGRGSRFRVRLPFSLGQTEVVEEGGNAGRELEAAFAEEYPLNVLIAEDDRINLKLVTRRLGKLGYAASKAANGLEAVACFESNGVDLILMDLQMPSMDGIEATRRIREIEATRPMSRSVFISALTANILPEDRERCLDSGMNAFLHKPLRREALEEVLREASAAKKGDLVLGEAVRG